MVFGAVTMNLPFRTGWRAGLAIYFEGAAAAAVFFFFKSCLMSIYNLSVMTDPPDL